MTYICERTFESHLDHLTDALHGLRVKLQNYLDVDIAVEHDPYHDDRFDEVEVPFLVQTYYHGCIEEREYPEWQESSCHRTRRGAEMALAWLVYHGWAEQDVMITENATVRRWELKYHPMEE